MKKLVLVRIGQVPNPAVTAALVPHMTGKPVAFPIPGAIVSVFDTPHSLERVSESVKETGAFFFLFELGTSQINLPEPVMELLGKISGNQPEPEEREWTMDEVLDLISANGIESLTPAQRRVLEGGRA